MEEQNYDYNVIDATDSIWRSTLVLMNLEQAPLLFLFLITWLLAK
jgi:hypothetical protein